MFTPFAKGGQGGLKAETVMAEGSQSPLTPLLQKGGTGMFISGIRLTQRGKVQSTKSYCA